MARKFYRLMMDEKLVDYYTSLEKALASGRQINVNRTRSSGGKKKAQAIKIVLDKPDAEVVYQDKA